LPLEVFSILPVRLIAIAGLLFLYFVVSAGLALVPISGSTKRRARIEVVSFFSAKLARVLGARIGEEFRNGGAPRVAGRGTLILANHLSFLDIVAISSLRPSVFVTSVEMERAPGAGLLAKWGGSLFVERRFRTRVLEDARSLAQVLSHGMDVVLFPEGTSGDGRNVLPFKAGLLRSAVSADLTVQPVCVQYETIGGRPISGSDAERVFFSGPLTLGRHLWNILTNPEVRITLRWLEPIPSAKGMDPREVAGLARERVIAAFRPVES